MITEDAFPYAAAAESHYAKEDTETMQVPAVLELSVRSHDLLRVWLRVSGPSSTRSFQEYVPQVLYPDVDLLEESGGDAALGWEGPTECDCEPGEPGFAGFAGPKVPTRLSLRTLNSLLFWKAEMRPLNQRHHRANQYTV